MRYISPSRLWSRLGYDDASGELGHFTTGRRVVPLSGLAIGLGGLVFALELTHDVNMLDPRGAFSRRRG